VDAAGEQPAAIEKRVRRALESAQKYSLVANSIKSRIVVEPEITIHAADGHAIDGGPSA